MNWPSGDPNQPPYQRPRYPPPAYPPPPPPPMPYQQSYGPPPGAYPGPAPKKSRKVLIVVLSVVAVLVLGGIATVSAVVYFAAKDKVVATALAAGDCLGDIPTSTLISVVPKVDCSAPHSGEVYAVLRMPDGDYPGEATIEQWKNECPPQLPSYSPSTESDPAVGVFVLYPTADTWATGDRAVTCIATTEAKRTGSIKG